MEPVRAVAANVDYLDCFDLGSGYLSLHASREDRNPGSGLSE
jgi:hypothetical protein